MTQREKSRELMRDFSTRIRDIKQETKRIELNILKLKQMFEDDGICPMCSTAICDDCDTRIK